MFINIMDLLFLRSSDLFSIFLLIDLYKAKDLWIAIPCIGFYLRSQIDSWIVRQIITVIVIISSFWSEAWNTVFYFILLEIFRYGHPFFIKWIISKYKQNRDLALETSFKKFLNKSGGIVKAITSYRDGVVDDPLTDEELNLQDTFFYMGKNLIIFNPLWIYRDKTFYWAKDYILDRTLSPCSKCKEICPTLKFHGSHGYCPDCTLMSPQC